MNYPWTRHYQRYEYVIQKGYVTDRNVVDIGCGFPIGSTIMTSVAESVIAIDKKLDKNKTYTMPQVNSFMGKPPRPSRIKLWKGGYEQIDKWYDVATAIEVFEHVNPINFIFKLGFCCEYLFLTTPLAKTTGPTRNKNHIAEYSHKEFVNIVTHRFDILEETYQTSDLVISNKGKYTGDSYNPQHTVQMLWCRNKGSKYLKEGD